MDSEKKTRTPIWLYVLLGLLAVALVFLAVRNSSLKNDKEMLEAEACQNTFHTCVSCEHGS